MFQFCLPYKITGCINLRILLAAGPQLSDSIKASVLQPEICQDAELPDFIVSGRIYSSIITPVVSGTISYFTVYTRPL